MNSANFGKLMLETEARIHPPEWKMFLEICDLYLKKEKIKNPVVVEVGLEEDSRSEFFKQLFNAEIKRVVCDEGIDILCIGGGNYKNVLRNFRVYAPHCTGIMVIYDIESCRYKKRKTSEAWKVWDELKQMAIRGEGEFEDFQFITIYNKRIRGNQRGIGVIIKG